MRRQRVLPARKPRSSTFEPSARSVTVVRWRSFVPAGKLTQERAFARSNACWAFVEAGVPGSPVSQDEKFPTPWTIDAPGGVATETTSAAVTAKSPSRYPTASKCS